MGSRRLSDVPWKRRRQIFKRIYVAYYQWEALIEDQGMQPFIKTIDGEVIDFHALMTGIDILPRRQRQAFELHCLRGMTESAAAREMGFKRWSTPVQQYTNMALYRMIKAYDQHQAGTWDPSSVKRRRKAS